MPRKNPLQYPASYWKIVEATVNLQEFRVPCETIKAARSLRASFYAYANCLREASTRGLSEDEVLELRTRADLASKIMVSTEGSVAIFQDKARFGHASLINKALAEQGLEELIPAESRD